MEKMQKSISPKVLTYRFHDFRPSDRVVLRDALHCTAGDSAFCDALFIYMDKWASADWLQEYDIERIAIWIANVAPTETVDKLLAQAAKKSQIGTENARKTYEVFVSSINSERKVLSVSGEQPCETRVSNP